MSLYSFEYFTAHKKNRKELSLPEEGLITLKNPLDRYHFLRGASRYTCLNASFTLEAAVILPLLTCFFVSLLFFFRVMQVELEVQKALDDTGRQLAVLLSGADGGSAAEFAAAEVLFLKELADSGEAVRYVSGGGIGISLLQSEFEQHEIRLNASYQIRLPVRIFGISSVPVEQTACCRKWTGWHAPAESGGSDEWVYITPMGTVYHLTDECTHLTLSIRSVGYGEVGALRNEDGGRYRPCAVCVDAKADHARVYITNQGDRYHADLNCTGIKRTIFLIRRSEVEGRSCCSRCMGYQR